VHHHNQKCKTSQVVKNAPLQPKMQNLPGCQECTSAAQNAKSPKVPYKDQGFGATQWCAVS